MTIREAKCFLNNIIEFNAKCQKSFEESDIAKSDNFREVYAGLAKIFEGNKKDAIAVLILLESKKITSKIKLSANVR